MKRESLMNFLVGRYLGIAIFSFTVAFTAYIGHSHLCIGLGILSGIVYTALAVLTHRRQR